MKMFAVIIGAVAGAFAASTILVYISCNWLWPTSNMCGIWGVLIGPPAGLLGGAALVYRLVYVKSQASAPTAPAPPPSAKRRQIESLALAVFGLTAFLAYRYAERVSCLYIASGGAALLIYFFVQAARRS